MTIDEQIDQCLLYMGFHQVIRLTPEQSPVFRRKNAPRSEPSITPVESQIVLTWPADHTQPTDVQILECMTEEILSRSLVLKPPYRDPVYVTLRKSQLVHEADGWKVTDHVSFAIGKLDFMI